MQRLKWQKHIECLAKADTPARPLIMLGTAWTNRSNFNSSTVARISSRRIIIVGPLDCAGYQVVAVESVLDNR